MKRFGAMRGLLHHSGTPQLQLPHHRLYRSVILHWRTEAFSKGVLILVGQQVFIVSHH